jgi:hypothetical protein
MTAGSGFAISTLVGPALRVNTGDSLDVVIGRHQLIRAERRIVPQ